MRKRRPMKLMSIAELSIDIQQKDIFIVGFRDFVTITKISGLQFLDQMVLKLFLCPKTQRQHKPPSDPERCDHTEESPDQFEIK